jgi:putative acetyltransferase
LRYRLHAFTVAHLPELTDLWVAAWSKAMPAIDFEARRTWFVDHLSTMKARGDAIICAFDAGNGTLAGVVTCDDSGYIDQLAVAPSYWGKGTAEALLAELKGRGRPLRLEVNQDNPRAVSFYEKQGFARRAAGVNPTSGLKTWRYEWTPAP